MSLVRGRRCIAVMKAEVLNRSNSYPFLNVGDLFESKTFNSGLNCCSKCYFFQICSPMMTDFATFFICFKMVILINRSQMKLLVIIFVLLAFFHLTAFQMTFMPDFLFSILFCYHSDFKRT